MANAAQNKTSEEKERTDFSVWTNGDSLPQSKEIQASGNFQGIQMSKLKAFMERVCVAPLGSVKRISDPCLSLPQMLAWGTTTSQEKADLQPGLS